MRANILAWAEDYQLSISEKNLRRELAERRSTKHTSLQWAPTTDEPIPGLVTDKNHCLQFQMGCPRKTLIRTRDDDAWPGVNSPIQVNVVYLIPYCHSIHDNGNGFPTVTTYWYYFNAVLPNLTNRSVSEAQKILLSAVMPSPHIYKCTTKTKEQALYVFVCRKAKRAHSIAHMFKLELENIILARILGRCWCCWCLCLGREWEYVEWEHPFTDRRYYKAK